MIVVGKQFRTRGIERFAVPQHIETGFGGLIAPVVEIFDVKKATMKRNTNKPSDINEVLRLFMECVCMGGCGSPRGKPINYVFRFTLSDEEIDQHPIEMATITKAIAVNKIELVSKAELDSFHLRRSCQKQGQNSQRYLRGIDQPLPVEGGHCI